MNFRDLKYVQALAKLGRFQDAAKACGVSQPTLSAQVKKLEDELGVAIFERKSRGILLTSFGEEFLKGCNRILTEYEDLKELAKLEKSPESMRLQIGSFPTLANYYFPYLIPYIKKLYPCLDLILHEDKSATLIENLDSGELDFILLAAPCPDLNFQSERLFVDPFYCAMSKDNPLTNNNELSLDMLLNQKILLLDEGHCLRDQVMSLCELPQNGHETYRGTSLETVRQMVRLDAGITLIPKIACRKDDDLVYLPLKTPSPQREILAVWRTSSPRSNFFRKLACILKKMKI